MDDWCFVVNGDSEKVVLWLDVVGEERWWHRKYLCGFCARKTKTRSDLDRPGRCRKWPPSSHGRLFRLSRVLLSRCWAPYINYLDRDWFSNVGVDFLFPVKQIGFFSTPFFWISRNIESYTLHRVFIRVQAIYWSMCSIIDALSSYLGVSPMDWGFSIERLQEQECQTAPIVLQLFNGGSHVKPNSSHWTGLIKPWVLAFENVNGLFVPYSSTSRGELRQRFEDTITAHMHASGTNWH